MNLKTFVIAVFCCIFLSSLTQNCRADQKRRVVVEEASSTNHWYHIEYPEGLTPPQAYWTYIPGDYAGSLTPYSPPPFSVARGLIEDIKALVSTEQLVQITLRRFQIAVQTKSPKAMQLIDKSIIKLLEARLGGHFSVTREKVQIGILETYTGETTTETKKLIPEIQRQEKERERNELRRRVMSDLKELKLGSLVDLTSEQLDTVLMPLDAKGSVTEWVVREVLQLPGVESAGLLNGKLYAWIDKAFDPKAARVDVNFAVQRAARKFDPGYA